MKTKAVKPTAEQLREAVEDASAFLRSMVKLVGRRGRSEVDGEFIRTMLAMADAILAPHLSIAGAAPDFFDSFPRVPATLFKDVLALVERELREDAEREIERMSDAKRAA
jgi:hypothetical protein